MVHPRLLAIRADAWGGREVRYVRLADVDPCSDCSNIAVSCDGHDGCKIHEESTRGLYQASSCALEPVLESTKREIVA